MRWSIRLGSLAGIGLYMHWTFLLLLGWALAARLMAGQGLGMALAGVGLIVALFGCVVLHELGHALTARRFGVGTRDITLLPIGGLARLDRIPEDPKQELAIALAGPAVNVMIAAALAGVLLALRGGETLPPLVIEGGAFLANLMWINVSLAVFNMLPAFPMDGGRVLRALLHFHWPHYRATQVAARIGQVMAILFVAVGLAVGNLLLVLIAGFVFLAGQAEAAHAQLKHAIRGRPVREAMTTDIHTLHPEQPIEAAAHYVMQGYRDDFPVVGDDEKPGLLRNRDVTRAILSRDTDLVVADLARSDLPTVDAGDLLSNAVDSMQAHDCQSMVVRDHGRVCGVLEMDHLGQWVAMQTALKQSRPEATARQAPDNNVPAGLSKRRHAGTY